MFDTFRVPICVQYVQIYMCNKSFQEKFVKGVHKLVAQYLSDGRQKVLQNYMIWRVVASFYPDQPSEEYHRRESCLKQTEDVFSPVVTSMYIRSKGVGKSEVAVEQVTMMVEAMQVKFGYFKGQLKFIYSEKAKKFCKIFTLLLTGTT